ncbi:MAG: acyl carrier protein [Wenzhouxiangella sp.]
MTSDSLRAARAAIETALDRALPEHPRIDWSHSLSAEAGLDSVQIMNLVMEVEDELDLSVPVDLLAEVNTLDELAASLAPLIEEQA